MAFPELGEAKKLEGDIRFHEVNLTLHGEPCRLWVYLPPVTGKVKIPGVFIAAAGAPGFHGMKLSVEDQPEHLPYAKTGFAVVAYDVSGALPEEASAEQLLAAVQAYRKAEAGVGNARLALDYAFANLELLDTKRIYAVGHSSAGTISLLTAQRDPRVTACVAYAPVTHAEEALGEDAIAQLTQFDSGFDEFLKDHSPVRFTDELKQPVFLFHGKKDQVVLIGSSARYVKKLQVSNERVSFVGGDVGDHYDSMIKKGIPAGIAWMLSLE